MFSAGKVPQPSPARRTAGPRSASAETSPRDEGFTPSPGKGVPTVNNAFVWNFYSPVRTQVLGGGRGVPCGGQCVAEGRRGSRACEGPPAVTLGEPCASLAPKSNLLSRETRSPSQLKCDR